MNYAADGATGYLGGPGLKVQTFGVAVVALMTVSTLAGAGILAYQAVAGASPQPTALQELPAAQTADQPGDNVAISAFKLVCPFH